MNKIVMAMSTSANLDATAVVFVGTISPVKPNEVSTGSIIFFLRTDKNIFAINVQKLSL